MLSGAVDALDQLLRCTRSTTEDALSELLLPVLRGASCQRLALYQHLLEEILSLQEDASSLNCGAMMIADKLLEHPNNLLQLCNSLAADMYWDCAQRDDAHHYQLWHAAMGITTWLLSCCWQRSDKKRTEHVMSVLHSAFGTIAAKLLIPVLCDTSCCISHKTMVLFLIAKQRLPAVCEVEAEKLVAAVCFFAVAQLQKDSDPIYSMEIVWAVKALECLLLRSSTCKAAVFTAVRSGMPSALTQSIQQLVQLCVEALKRLMRSYAAPTAAVEKLSDEKLSRWLKRACKQQDCGSSERSSCSSMVYLSVDDGEDLGPNAGADQSNFPAILLSLLLRIIDLPEHFALVDTSQLAHSSIACGQLTALFVHDLCIDVSECISEKLAVTEQRGVWKMLLFCCDLWNLSLHLAVCKFLSPKASTAECQCSEIKNKSGVNSKNLMELLNHGNEAAVCACQRQALLFNLLAPRNGVGALMKPMQAIMRNSRLACAKCFYAIAKALIAVGCGWHRKQPTTFKLLIRCFHHLISTTSPATSGDAEATEVAKVVGAALFLLCNSITWAEVQDVLEVSVALSNSKKQQAVARISLRGVLEFLLTSVHSNQDQTTDVTAALMKERMSIAVRCSTVVFTNSLKSMSNNSATEDILQELIVNGLFSQPCFGISPDMFQCDADSTAENGSSGQHPTADYVLSLLNLLTQCLLDNYSEHLPCSGGLTSVMRAWQVGVTLLVKALFHQLAAEHQQHSVLHTPERCKDSKTSQRSPWYQETQIDSSSIFTGLSQQLPPAGPYDGSSMARVEQNVGDSIKKPQLVLLSSFSPALRIANSFALLVMKLWRNIWSKGAPNGICEEFLNCRAALLESVWWVFHRLTALGIEVHEDIMLELGRQFDDSVLKHLFRCAPHSMAGMTMLLTLKHITSLSHVSQGQKHVDILIKAVRKCMNSMTESGVLPAMLRWLPHLVSIIDHNPSGRCNGKDASVVLIAPHISIYNAEVSAFVVRFYKLLLLQLQGMAQPSSSEQHSPASLNEMVTAMQHLSIVPFHLATCSSSVLLELFKGNENEVLDCWRGVLVMWLQLEQWKGGESELDSVSECEDTALAIQVAINSKQLCCVNSLWHSCTTDAARLSEVIGTIERMLSICLIGIDVIVRPQKIALPTSACTTGNLLEQLMIVLQVIITSALVGTVNVVNTLCDLSTSRSECIENRDKSKEQQLMRRINRVIADCCLSPGLIQRSSQSLAHHNLVLMDQHETERILILPEEDMRAQRPFSIHCYQLILSAASSVLKMSERCGCSLSAAFSISWIQAVFFSANAAPAITHGSNSTALDVRGPVECASCAACGLLRVMKHCVERLKATLMTMQLDSNMHQQYVEWSNAFADVASFFSRQASSNYACSCISSKRDSCSDADCCGVLAWWRQGHAGNICTTPLPAESGALDLYSCTSQEMSAQNNQSSTRVMSPTIKNSRSDDTAQPQPSSMKVKRSFMKAIDALRAANDSIEMNENARVAKRKLAMTAAVEESSAPKYLKVALPETEQQKIVSSVLRVKQNGETEYRTKQGNVISTNTVADRKNLCSQSQQSSFADSQLIGMVPSQRCGFIETSGDLATAPDANADMSSVHLQAIAERSNCDASYETQINATIAKCVDEAQPPATVGNEATVTSVGCKDATSAVELVVGDDAVATATGNTSPQSSVTVVRDIMRNLVDMTVKAADSVISSERNACGDDKFDEKLSAEAEFGASKFEDQAEAPATVGSGNGNEAAASSVGCKDSSSASELVVGDDVVAIATGNASLQSSVTIVCDVMNNLVDMTIENHYVRAIVENVMQQLLSICTKQEDADLKSGVTIDRGTIHGRSNTPEMRINEANYCDDEHVSAPASPADASLIAAYHLHSELDQLLQCTQASIESSLGSHSQSVHRAEGEESCLNWREKHATVEEEIRNTNSQDQNPLHVILKGTNTALSTALLRLKEAAACSASVSPQTEDLVKCAVRNCQLLTSALQQIDIKSKHRDN